MKSLPLPIILAGSLLGALISGAGCAQRMTVATGTTIGLHATPGDGQSQTPQITLAYKRSEVAIIPTGERAARNMEENEADTDAYSALAVIDFQTRWWGDTSVDQFIATGHAARDIQEEDSVFAAELAKPTFDLPPEALRQGIADLRRAIVAQRTNKTDAQRQLFAVALLGKLGLSSSSNETAEATLDQAITKIQDEATLKRFRNAFESLPKP